MTEREDWPWFDEAQGPYGYPQREIQADRIEASYGPTGWARSVSLPFADPRYPGTRAVSHWYVYDTRSDRPRSTARLRDDIIHSVNYEELRDGQWARKGSESWTSKDDFGFRTIPEAETSRDRLAAYERKTGIYSDSLGSNLGWRPREHPGYEG